MEERRDKNSYTDITWPEIQTRVTTKYSIKPVKLRTKTNTEGATTPTTPAEPKPARASLVIKTYDPVSGVTLKYRTTKAAEVTRLIHASLGRLGRAQAALPDVPEVAMPDADAAPAETTGAAPGDTTAAPPPQQSGGKKKKKGKR